jgi:Type II secretion system (T2SS), protein E, N-terminal domain
MAIRLGDLLVKAKVINESQLKAALAEQQKWGGKLGELLVRMNFLTEDMLVKALSKQMTVPSVNLETIQGIPPHVRAKVPPEVARDLVALPLQLRDDNKTLLVAMAEPQNLKHLDTLRSVSRCRITPQLAGRQAIARAFARFYEGETEVGDVEDSFKLVDAQGHTLIKSAEELKNERRPTTSSQPAVRAPVAAPPPPARAMSAEVPSSASGKSPAEMLRSIEDAQRKEVTALKGMVELLIEKGVFTRDEYLAKVKR